MIEGSDYDIYMEGFLIRERIFGRDNIEFRFFIRYRGVVFVDFGNFDFCIGLWGYVMKIG